MVVEAYEVRPPLNARSVEVAADGNGYPNEDNPNELVAVSVYPPDELPRRSWPYEGAVVRPVPP
jgi:hypothetical protein